jgi:hydroxymethylbilane synthase
VKTIRIATRKSALALWQAEHVAREIERHHPSIRTELVPRSTFGDEHLSTPLNKLGGKALFMKELEQAMLAGDADIAVHSMKDVPAELPPGMVLSTILDRDDPFDAFVSNRYPDLDAMPEGAVVGTSSLRRRAQLLALRPDLEIRDLRGNINTRQAKLDAGEFDAIVLACAGLKRLEMGARIAETLAPPRWLPAVGQGALGIEHLEDQALSEILAPLNDTKDATCVLAERAFNHTLEGSCHVPVAAYAHWLDDQQLQLHGLVASIDGQQVLRDSVSGRPETINEQARAMANKLLEQGGRAILDEVNQASS